MQQLLEVGEGGRRVGEQVWLSRCGVGGLRAALSIHVSVLHADVELFYRQTAAHLVGLLV